MSRGCWISIDGVEGAGKTTFARALEAALDPPPLLIAEFSETLVGDYLRAGVQRDPHFFGSSRLGQSLIFLGDFFERHGNVVEPAIAEGKVVIQDRGYLSKYAYQFEVLREGTDVASARDLLDGIFATVTPPDVTVLLSAPNEVIHDRLIARGEIVDADRARFIDGAQKVFESRALDAGRLLEFDTASLSPAEIVAEVFAALPQLVRP